MIGSPSIVRVLTLCGGKISLSVRWDWRDLWVGAFWDMRYDDTFDGLFWHYERKLYIWVCLVPMLPVCVGLPWPGKRSDDG